MLTLQVPAKVQTTPGKTLITPGASAEKGLGAGLGGEDPQMDKETIEVCKDTGRSPNPTCAQEVPCPSVSTLPSQESTSEDTSHFLEKGALELQHITPALSDQEKEPLEQLVCRV